MPKTNYQYVWSTAVKKARIELKGREGKLAADRKKHEDLGMQVLDKEVMIDRSDEKIANLRAQIEDLKTEKKPIMEEVEAYEILKVEKFWQGDTPPKHAKALEIWNENHKPLRGGYYRIYAKMFNSRRMDASEIDKKINELESGIAAEEKARISNGTALKKLQKKEESSFRALRAGEADLAEFGSILDQAFVENVQKTLKSVDAVDGTAQKCLLFQSHATVWRDARSKLGDHRDYPEVKAILDTLNDIADDVASLEKQISQVRASAHDLGSFKLFDGNARNDLKNLTGVAAVGGLKVSVGIETPKEALDDTVSLSDFKGAAAAAAAVAQSSAKSTLISLNSDLGAIMEEISAAQAELEDHEDARQRVQRQADSKKAEVDRLDLEIENGVHYNSTGNRFSATDKKLKQTEINKKITARKNTKNSRKDDVKYLKDAPGERKKIETRKAAAERKLKTQKGKAAGVPAKCLDELTDSIVAAVYAKWASCTSRNSIYENYVFEVTVSN